MTGATAGSPAGSPERHGAERHGAGDVPLLSVEDLRTWFATPRGMVHAVDGVSLRLAAGGSLGIVGESGSGKSVLARSIMNLLPANAVTPGGRVLFDGRDVRAMSRGEAQHFWGTQMAIVFQDPMTSLNPVRQIGAQLTEGLRYHLGLSRKAATERAVDLLHQVRVPEARRRLAQYPHELSGGTRQRVTIAMALACEPRLLIADEPTTALDVTVQKRILDLLGGLAEQHRMAMILITHDLAVVAGRTDRVAVMYAGQIVESAPTSALFGAVRHPYAEALLNSIPRVDQPSHTKLDAIAGRPPDMVQIPPGCRFAPRCPYARTACTEQEPQQTEVVEPAGARTFRCHFPLGLAPREADLEGADREGADPDPDGADAHGLGPSPAEAASPSEVTG